MKVLLNLIKKNAIMSPALSPKSNNEVITKKEAISILLVDDNDSTNFFNKIVIERNVFTQITLASNGLEALNHIKQLLKENKAVPEYILLDINMPVMNGWEFLEAYINLTPLYKNSKIVFNLGIELRDCDKEMINQLDLNYIFTEKMMSKDIIKNIIAA